MDIRAIYELKRQGFLIGYTQNPERFDDALAFAYENRLAPVFHEVILRETHGEDPFKDAYAVSAEFMNEVLDYIDERWRDKKFDELGFYDLESHFGGHHAKRIELIHTIEYARITGRFDDDLYNAVESNAPSEANSIDSTFSANDVNFN
ncbi:hypothetical protein GGR95_001392 [Sulfitobacter undariae]|uniref:Uncharacterized protein n=2 Tax=Sulfitobacter undariae TaxID=1563671 RepID=A0A7W6E5B6_9RHOB|nr:hypothetical protein [Sulfitobacter undariae]